MKQEKELIRQQCQSHQRELAAAQDYARQQSAKIQCLEKEKIELSSRMEQDTLCARVDAADNVIQLMKDKGDLELQCRQLKANLAGTDRSEMYQIISRYRCLQTEQVALLSQTGRAMLRVCQQLASTVQNVE